MPQQKAGGTRSEIRIAAYCLGWALCFVGAKYVLRNELLSGHPIAWLVAALPSVAGVWLMIAYTRYLRQADELDRLIQLESMAWAFGGGFFAICGYMLFEHLGAPEVDAATLATIMPVMFALGTLAGRWRYR